MLHPVSGVLCVEGEQTGDGRFIVEGALTWAALPLPLAWIVGGDQHVDMVMEAPQVGTIDTITRAANLVVFTGMIDDQIPEGAEMVRRMQAGSAPLGDQFGLSIDPDDWAVDLIDTEADDAAMVMLSASGVGSVPDFTRGFSAAAGEGEPDGEVVMTDSADSLIARYTRLRIRGAAACSVAAFTGGVVGLTPSEAASATADTSGSSGTGGSVTVTVNPAATAETEAFSAAHGPFSGSHSHRHAAFGDQGSDQTHEHSHSHSGDAVHDHPHTEAEVASAAPCADCEQEAAETAQLAPVVPLPAVVAAATGVPESPPADWFDDPTFAPGDGRMVRQPNGAWACPLTVTADGQVFGHLASWSNCHTAYQNACVRPPRSATGYAAFMLRPLMTADGSVVKVGHLTMGCGHASTDGRMSADEVRAHYDGGPGAVRMASVCVGEDEYGVWFAGSLVPGVTDEQVRAFSACSLSGDWREVWHGRGLDLVACVSVISPGFPIAAAGLVAAGVDVAVIDGLRGGDPAAVWSDGRITSLVAAGVVRQPLPWERTQAELLGRLEALEGRVEAAERVTRPLQADAVGRVLDRVPTAPVSARAAVDALTAAVERALPSRNGH